MHACEHFLSEVTSPINLIHGCPCGHTVRKWWDAIKQLSLTKANLSTMIINYKRVVIIWRLFILICIAHIDMYSWCVFNCRFILLQCVNITTSLLIHLLVKYSVLFCSWSSRNNDAMNNFVIWCVFPCASCYSSSRLYTLKKNC